MPSNIYDLNLDKNQANYQPLTPLSFLRRTADVYPNRIAVVHGDVKFTYAEFYARCRRLASALSKRGIGRGDTVAILCPNIPQMLEAHYGVPFCAAVINTLNYRLDAAAIAFILDHGEAKVLIVDREFSGLARDALALCKTRPLVIDVDDPEFTGEGSRIGEIDYESFIAKGDPDFTCVMPGDEWDAIALNYTSGTTGNPKGVVFHHRGAYLLAMGNVVTASMQKHPVYLWTLPMFHCNGWCFTWSLSVAAGTHVCLRRTEAALIYAAIDKYKVTHMCGAPVVMGMLINAKPEERKSFSHNIEFFTAAAPPPASVIGAMTASGFSVTHLYGLTETYGPAVINDWHEEWNALPPDEQATIKARQGVRYPVLEALTILDPDTMQPVPNDGETMGEVMFRGNVVMKGYLKNPSASKESFEGGWYHSGDLGVLHPDGYIQLRDRSKDIIISGGENISSIEVEDTLYKHPGILEAAVVARADEKWGETPCAFVTLKHTHQNLTAQDIIAYCRENLAHYKCPRHVVFTELPKTSTGKVQKFRLREMTKDVG
ncbi:MAG TPA: acyl-CoA synthetase [Alphaproteobacteria bacterium]|nr:acyl-CoA synthetase [Alphaproteobacteria bacterium]